MGSSFEREFVPAVDVRQELPQMQESRWQIPGPTGRSTFVTTRVLSAFLVVPAL
jgi:hypothetical protein